MSIISQFNSHAHMDKFFVCRFLENYNLVTISRPNIITNCIMFIMVLSALVTVLFLTNYIPLTGSTSSAADNFIVDSSTENEDNCGVCSSLHFNKSSDYKHDYEGEERIIGCYFTNWAWYRSGAAKFMPSNINASLCTHIFYAFAILNGETMKAELSDPWADVDNKMIEKVVALGKPTFMSFGGWTNSGGNRWSRMLHNETTRAIFINSVIIILETYGFRGCDLDVEYPACPQGDASAGSQADKENFNLLVSEMKGKFNGKYLVTATVAAGKKIIDGCYNMGELCQLADWTQVMTYDYHSYLDRETGANAPFCRTDSSWGVYNTMKYFVHDLKCPPNKLVMGIPFYGKTFTLASASDHSFGAPITGPGTAGNFTSSVGTLAYYEICMRQAEGWSTGTDKCNDSYAYRDTQFVSFDSIADIKRKACLINKCFKLKGAMFWTLDYDDFNNICGCGSYPLLTALNQQLRCLDTTCVECY